MIRQSSKKLTVVAILCGIACCVSAGSAEAQFPRPPRLPRLTNTPFDPNTWRLPINRPGSGQNVSGLQVVTGPHIDANTGRIYSGSGNSSQNESVVGQAQMVHYQGRAYWVSNYSNRYGRVNSPVRAPSRFDRSNSGISGGTTLLNRTGTLSGNDRYDYHTVRLIGGRTYTISLTSSQFDTYLIVRSQSGGTVARDDDGGNGLNSRVVFRPQTSGEYQIVVTSYQRNGRGTYRVKVER